MRSLGVNAYRFSISWSRVLPEGGERINKKGLSFNSSLVDALIESGIIPFVTLYHFDPLRNYKKSGWLRWGIVKDFEFADVVSSKLKP